MTTKTFCSACDAELPQGVESEPSDARTPCSACGGTGRRFEKKLTATVSAKASLKFVAKRPGMKRPMREDFHGAELQASTGTWMDKDRVIDRMNNDYSELVVDSETGQVVHQDHEPLDQHFDHGSARKP